MQVNRLSFRSAAAVMLILISAGAAFGENEACAQCPHKGQGFGGQFMARLEQLNLTADQSQQISSIIKLNQEAVKTAMSQLKDTREALNRQIHSGPFDEKSVRETCRKAAAAEEETAVLRARLSGQIRAVLTGDQQAALDKMQAEARDARLKPGAKERGMTGK